MMSFVVRIAIHSILDGGVVNMKRLFSALNGISTWKEEMGTIPSEEIEIYLSLEPNVQWWDENNH